MKITLRTIRARGVKLRRRRNLATRLMPTIEHHAIRPTRCRVKREPRRIVYHMNAFDFLLLSSDVFTGRASCDPSDACPVFRLHPSAMDGLL
ncbi:hypothetical protein LINPERHAP1_LOCUS27057 [Linum perenne]